MCAITDNRAGIVRQGRRLWRYRRSIYFRGKHELLLSGIHDLLRSARPAAPPVGTKRYERLIWFSLPIFKFLERHRHTAGGRIGTRDRAVIHGHLREALADLIADDLRKDMHGRPSTTGRVPPDLLIQYVASTFILTLNWWMETRSPLPPKDADDVFRALILPTLSAALG
ncbi:MAG: hypothetical protein H0V43_05550 [Gemmatimonadales bacterium]|nr:hypothetical protein [Gemmatimonadales bacterium]MBA3554057.1 hypothetical protein [Gemmatimonadales bacterium]